MCVYEGFKLKRRLAWLHRTLYKKKREIFFKKRRSIDRKNLQKNKKEKKTRDFHSPRQTRF